MGNPTQIAVHNVRLGFATNSSSTHSLVFLPEGVKANDGYESGKFGWDNFVVASEEGKRSYLGIVLWDHLHRAMPDSVAKLVCRKWVGNVPDEDDYVDHQSLYPLPSDFHNPAFPDEEFFGELRDFVLQRRLAILGGNDNDYGDDPHPLAQYGTFRIPENDRGYNDEMVCRKDQQGYWTLFSRKDGTKVRFSFSAEAKAGKPVFDWTPTKGHGPELVDVKITDACSKGCPYCYQDSKPDGVHADLHGLIEALSELKVFEVALGGGEPTSHPDFVTIVRRFRESGVVPNFSTKSLGWLRDDRKWPSVVENCGKFALSVETADEAKDMMALVQSKGICRDKVGLQVIIGLVESWEFCNILEFATKESVPITLLGYKPVGRGKDVRPLRPEERHWWLDRIAEREGCAPIGIDTTLAKEFDKELKEAKVPGILYETEEGKFSCYIDAVRGRIGPSSFCSEEKMQPLDGNSWDLADKIVEAFAKF
jgi:MoaA/NifB/PqqE/SkfB family radical SAM enzyme